MPSLFEHDPENNFDIPKNEKINKDKSEKRLILEKNLESQAKADDIQQETEKITLAEQKDISNAKDQKVDIGKTIKNARLAKKITLEQVSKDTKIRTKYLLALEENDFASLPEAVIIKGFLKIFAGYLEIDQQNLLDAFNQELNAKKILEQEKIEEKKNASQKYYQKNIKKRNNTKDNYKTIVSLMKAMLIIILILLFIFASYILLREVFKAINSKSNNNSVVLNSSDYLIETNGNFSTINALANNISNVSQNKMEFTIKTIKDAWIKVVVDDAVVLHGMLAERQTKTWTAKNYVTIRSPEASHIRIIVDKIDQGLLGKDNTITQKTFKVKN